MRCGKLFKTDGREIRCHDCRKEEENSFSKVRDFLWNNPNSTLEEIHLKTGIDHGIIMRFIREGRLKQNSKN